MFVFPLVILGGVLSAPAHYAGMKAWLEKATGQKVYTVPVTTWDWVASISASGWARIMDKLGRTVAVARQECGSERVVLIGHSSGGVMARLFLSPSPFCGRIYAGVDSVRGLISLGSPHQNFKGSPMRRKVQRFFPGAFFSPPVRYLSVAGRAVLGRKQGSHAERSSYRSYRILCGKGQVWGDGMVPLSSALLDGGHPFIIDDVFHDFRKNRRWYGSPDVLELWWNEFLHFLEKD